MLKQRSVLIEVVKRIFWTSRKGILRPTHLSGNFMSLLLFYIHYFLCPRKMGLNPPESWVGDDPRKLGGYHPRKAGCPCKLASQAPKDGSNYMANWRYYQRLSANKSRQESGSTRTWFKYNCYRLVTILNDINLSLTCTF